MSQEYNLCPICGGVKPTRYLWKPTSETDPTPVAYPDTGPFPLCKCPKSEEKSEPKEPTGE